MSQPIGEYQDLDGSKHLVYSTEEQEDLFEELLDIAVNAGFEPGDECPIPWIAIRYEGYRFTGTSEDTPILCFDRIDGELNLYVMSYSGVLLAKAEFTLNPLGLALFAAALKGTP